MPIKKQISSMLSFATLLLLIAGWGYQTAHAKQQQPKQKRPIPKPVPIPKQGKLVPKFLDDKATEEAIKWYAKFFNTTWTPGFHYTLVHDARPITPEEKKLLYLGEGNKDVAHHLTLREIRGWDAKAKRILDFIDIETSLKEKDLEWRGELLVKEDWISVMPDRKGQWETPYSMKEVGKSSPARGNSNFYPVGVLIEKRGTEWIFTPSIKFPTMTAPTDQQLDTGDFTWVEYTYSAEMRNIIAKARRDGMEKAKKLDEEFDKAHGKEVRPNIVRRGMSPGKHLESAEHNAGLYVETHFTECDGAFYTVEVGPLDEFRVLRLQTLNRKLEPLSLDGEDSNVIWKGKLTISAPSYQIFYARKGSTAGKQGGYVGSVILRLRTEPLRNVPNTVVERANFANDPSSEFPLSYAPLCGWLTPERLQSVRDVNRIITNKQ